MRDVTCGVKGNDQQWWLEGRKESLHFLPPSERETLATAQDKGPAKRGFWTHFMVLMGLGSKLPSASTEICFSNVAEILVSK